jgi:hypothetical protein
MTLDHAVNIALELSTAVMFLSAAVFLLVKSWR